LALVGAGWRWLALAGAGLDPNGLALAFDPRLALASASCAAAFYLCV